jgi:hypothetical protein
MQASFRTTPNSLCAKLSHGLALAGWGARPNCNIVLNCAGSSRHLLRQKLQDGKHISFSESAKRLLCNIHQNGWRITWGTQLERGVLPLESHSYNKSHPSHKAYCFSKIVDRTLFLIVLNPCLTFLNNTYLSFTPNQVCFLVHICHRAMLVHLRASTLQGVGPPSSHVVLISHWLRVFISIYCPKEYRLWSRRWSIPSRSSYLDGGCRP